jgi:hypothetical protein
MDQIEFAVAIYVGQIEPVAPLPPVGQTITDLYQERPFTAFRQG